jgi:chlorobactene glucosyltransferase
MKKDLWLNLSACFSITMSVAGWWGLRKILKEAQEFSQQMKSSKAIGKMPFVSIIIPARNEERNIGESLESVLKQEYSNFEIIAIDDHSQDNTLDIIQKYQAQYPKQLKVAKVGKSFEGWLGKTNALKQGYELVDANSDWLLFVDADTKLAPDALGSAMQYAQAQKLALFSFVPKVKTISFWASLLYPEVMKFYALLPGNPVKSSAPDTVETASAVGAFILVQKKAYDAIDGHSSVKNEVIEDIKLAQAFRRAGYQTHQVPGADFVETTWYNTLPEIWEGASKNLFLVGKGSWAKVVFVIGVEWLYGCMPFILLGWQGQKLVAKSKKSDLSKLGWLLNGLASASVLSFYGYSSKRLGVPAYYGLLYPFSAWVSSTILINSAVQIGILKKVRWKDRTIALSFVKG